MSSETHCVTLSIQSCGFRKFDLSNFSTALRRGPAWRLLDDVLYKRRYSCCAADNEEPRDTVLHLIRIQPRFKFSSFIMFPRLIYVFMIRRDPCFHAELYDV